MSFYEDYVADGLCCASCGTFIDGQEDGYARLCSACQSGDDEEPLATVKSKPWVCSSCDKRFARRYDRTQHVRMTHKAKSNG